LEFLESCLAEKVIEVKNLLCSRVLVPGRAMARSGLRMMPTFPSPPLKFRTVGFPQYGFKAGMSKGTFLITRRIKPAPGILRHMASLSPFFACVLKRRKTWF